MYLYDLWWKNSLANDCIELSCLNIRGPTNISFSGYQRVQVFYVILSMYVVTVYNIFQLCYNPYQRVHVFYVIFSMFIVTVHNIFQLCYSPLCYSINVMLCCYNPLCYVVTAHYVVTVHHYVMLLQPIMLCCYSPSCTNYVPTMYQQHTTYNSKKIVAYCTIYIMIHYKICSVHIFFTSYLLMYVIFIKDAVVRSKSHVIYVVILVTSCVICVIITFIS